MIGMVRIAYKVSTICKILIILAIFYGGITVSAAPITLTPSDGIDAILVIDTSGSMRTADPERITLEAASLFMDMMETRNSRIGIVGFSGGLHSVMPLTPINDPAIRDTIRTNISNFVYHGWTDIGLALREAANMLLDDPEPNNSPMILLFTDGRIELNQWGDRTVEESYTDAWWAVDAVGGFAPIYTIGLNYDGSLHIEFLEEIARRTNAASYIADDASELPQIFNEIFASHIRSSITEVATIVLGDSFTDIFIPIPSPFVSEANIIMLSSQPITNLRLFDPSGREVFFDGDLYTLTYANRYSMIKILNPIMGEWLLSVQGVPEERITVNLIYNYNVDIAFSVNQPDHTGHLFDPEKPLTVQAGFISPLPGTQIQALFSDAQAELIVYDMSMSPLGTIPMRNTGTSFISYFAPTTPQDVRVSVRVVHPGFEQTTALLTINFDPDLLANLVETPPTPTPTPTPSPTPTPPPTPTPSPVPVDDNLENGTSLVPILLGALGVIAIVAMSFRIYGLNQNKHRVFTGYLEMRAMLEDGNYTALEAPDLSTFAGKLSLMSFLNNTLGSKAEKIYQANIPIWDIYIQPGNVNDQHVLHLVNSSTGCQITDTDGNILSQKKIIWHNNNQLIFANPDATARLEVTYRVED